MSICRRDTERERLADVRVSEQELGRDLNFYFYPFDLRGMHGVSKVHQVGFVNSSDKGDELTCLFHPF